MTKLLAKSEVWLVTGSQNLYGPGPLQEVAANSRRVARTLCGAAAIPMPVVFKAVMTTADAIRTLCMEANHSPQCAGLILWMHTFSPSKMWIGGLSVLQKPFAHLHTQFNRDLPWGEIDMDFMNLNQAAHGDREAGFMHARMRLPRKIVVGHWEDPEVQERLGAWMRVARGWQDMQGALRPVRGQHEARRRHRRRQGRRRGALRLRGRRLRGRRPGRGDPGGVASRRRQALLRVRGSLRGRGSCGPGGAPRVAAGGRADRARPSLVPREGRTSRDSRPPSRTSTACGSCPASRSSG
jgi:hypothetical protein